MPYSVRLNMLLGKERKIGRTRLTSRRKHCGGKGKRNSDYLAEFFNFEGSGRNQIGY